MTKVAIIGAGEIGRTLGLLIRRHGYPVTFWDKAPEKLLNLDQDPDLALPAIINNAEVLFLCVPSGALKEVLFFIEPYLKPKQAIVSLIKGLEGSKNQLPVEFIGKIAPKCQLAVLGGPMLAEELQAGGPGIAILASKRESVLNLVAPLLRDAKLQVETSSDVTGVALAGVLKNIYALGMGIGEELAWSANARASYLTEALKEIIGTGKFLGAKAETFIGPAGLGDLLATGLSRNSLNYQVGQALARNEEPKQVSEGLVSLPLLFSLLGTRVSKLPILLLLKKIALEGA
ncbi:MAG: 2-dehydropantoate 2-reductase N-terminal domain-containing protein, partial [Patescibacteria group bacterium]